MDGAEDICGTGEGSKVPKSLSLFRVGEALLLREVDKCYELYSLLFVARNLFFSFSREATSCENHVVARILLSQEFSRNRAIVARIFSHESCCHENPIVTRIFFPEKPVFERIMTSLGHVWPHELHGFTSPFL